MARSYKILIGAVLCILLISGAGILWYRLQTKKNSKSSTTEEHALPPIKVILNNGCGFEGVATEFSNYLADKNVDVVLTGNTMRPIYDKTIIVNRKGSTSDLERLMRITGISRYTEAKMEDALADFEIIIGKDYETYTKSSD